MKMPQENIDRIMFAPCGMNCKVCYKHCYHKKPCAGCLNSDKGKPEHCRRCRIKDCIREKHLSYCYECSEYPCKLIKNLEKSYKKRYQASLIENSVLFKHMVWSNSWYTKKKNTRVPDVVALFPFMTENAVNARKK